MPIRGSIVSISNAVYSGWILLRRGAIEDPRVDVRRRKFIWEKCWTACDYGTIRRHAVISFGLKYCPTIEVEGERLIKPLAKLRT